MTTTVELGKVAVPRGLVGGPFGSSLVSKDYVDDGVPVIRGSNLGHGKWIGGEFAYVTPEKFERDLARNSAIAGDLVFTQRGTLGQVALVPSGLADQLVVSQSQMRLRVDPTRFDAHYIYYACTDPAFVRTLSDRAIRTGVPHINLGILAELSVPDRRLEEQRAIAEVLGALDDKIAANDRLAQSVLELADARFALAARDASSSEATFADVASIKGGGTPSTKVDEFWNGDINWATPTDVTALRSPYLEVTSRRITAAGFAACSSDLHPAGSILMTSRATIGAFAIAQKPTAVNQGFIVVNANDPRAQWWLFHEMRRQVPEFLSHANGATFLELSRGKFRSLTLCYPDESTLQQFDEVAKPLHQRAVAASRESAVLTELRDTLLPALMSGRLTVSEAEMTVSEAI